MSLESDVVEEIVTALWPFMNEEGWKRWEAITNKAIEVSGLRLRLERLEKLERVLKETLD